MGIPQMKPQEKRVSCCFKPVYGIPNTLFRAPFVSNGEYSHDCPENMSTRIRKQPVIYALIIEPLKSPVPSVLAREVSDADSRTCFIAGMLQHGREGFHAVRKRPSVSTDTMRIRVAPGE